MQRDREMRCSTKHALWAGKLQNLDLDPYALFLALTTASLILFSLSFLPTAPTLTTLLCIVLVTPFPFCSSSIAPVAVCRLSELRQLHRHHLSTNCCCSPETLPITCRLRFRAGALLAAKIEAIEMGDLKSRLNSARVKLLRRSTGGSHRDSKHHPQASPGLPNSHDQDSEPRRRSPLHSSSSRLHPDQSTLSLSSLPSTAGDASSKRQLSIAVSAKHEHEHHRHPSSETSAERHTLATDRSISINDQHPIDVKSASISTESSEPPVLTLEKPTPDSAEPPTVELVQSLQLPTEDALLPVHADPSVDDSHPHVHLTRKQSLVASSNARVVETLLKPEKPRPTPGSLSADYFSSGPGAFSASMLQRKIWVKRPSASATLVTIKEDDLVDDVRDMILRKYANSLGRSFDAPDLTIRIVTREQNQKGTERTLGPEEDMCRTLDTYYPGGQTVEEALLIDIPSRRTPRPSPRHPFPPHVYHYDDARPAETGTEYFPPMPVIAASSPAALTSASHDSRVSHGVHDRAMSVLNTGHVPPLPSPGGTRRPHHPRPKNPRHHTSSPTTVTTTAPISNSQRPLRIRHDSSASDSVHSVPAPPPLPTPPAPEVVTVKTVSTPPIPRAASPRPKQKTKRPKPANNEHSTPSLPAGLLDGSVPPINVLIVEDNMINLRVLGAFMERLKVRWQRAMNGREAVTKWRAGGFHLVLMDIQLPIMNGLEATKEIRRLERVNNIGVFSSSSSEAPDLGSGESKELSEEDKLGDDLLFKSPVIIVALTASSLQSDRHEALAAGCNDFLTKVSSTWHRICENDTDNDSL